MRGEEERDHAIADVPADQSSRVDDALVGGTSQAPSERDLGAPHAVTGCPQPVCTSSVRR